jgi:hypothetical protein
LLQTAIPAIPPGPVLTPAPPPAAENTAQDFFSHFFFETRTEYWRTQTSFSGQPTLTGVINAPLSPFFNPNGIPDPSVFQPSSNDLYSFMDWGTRGWLSDRVNTDFSFRYRQDLTHVDEGSPELSILNTFGANRRFELLTGNIEINGRPSDGFFADSTLRLGRQYIYGAELAALDGASFAKNKTKYSWTIFAGRRFTYFGDPDQRAIGGLDLVYRFSNRASLEYDGLFYIKGSHSFTYRQDLGHNWLFNTYFKLIGSFPVDYSANGFWNSESGKTTIGLSFFQKLTNKDFIYDYTVNARDLDPFNSVFRLNLGPISPYTQFAIDAHRQVNSRLRLGGSVAVHRLDDPGDQGPFDVSFQDYRGDAQIFPWRKLETFLEYHENDSDRKTPFPSTVFDDLSAAGQTKIQDFTAELGRSFSEGRYTVRGGGFFRRINFQDRFVLINNAQDKGWLGSAAARLDQRTKLFFDYSLDTDYFVWRPSIRHAQVLRLGVDWKY